MKDCPELTGRIWDIIETVVLACVAVLLCYCVYLALYFAINILEGV